MRLRLALTGFGNVGQGVTALLRDHWSEYKSRYGVDLILVGIADRGGAAILDQGINLARILEGKAAHGTVAAGDSGVPGLAGKEFLERANADVLLEAASTNFDDAEPGWSYVTEALNRGMDIVLASKGALVLHFAELMERAQRAKRTVKFAGTVGAPLPVLELAERVLVGARIDGFEGILNATTNQILTSMEEGASYEEGVRRAQAIGIAETDPTLDVDGWDAAAKAVIVANAVLGGNLQLEDVKREGIRSVTRADLGEAAQRGETIKLIVRVERRNGVISAQVAPETRTLNDDLGRLRNAEMGLVYHTRPLGKVTATVQQTGGIPTALTVLRDVINLTRNRS